MAGPRPMLTFKMRLPVKPEKTLILGVLYLQHENKVQQNFLCTSGLPGWQFRESQLLPGRGPLPSSAHRKEQLYAVKTEAMRMTDAGHSSSKFYAIHPHSVRIGEIVRGDFGIHQDLNSPGTAGCIGIPDRAIWLNFMEAMERLREKSLTTVPLAVIYY